MYLDLSVCQIPIYFIKINKRMSLISIQKTENYLSVEENTEEFGEILTVHLISKGREMLVNDYRKNLQRNIDFFK